VGKLGDVPPLVLRCLKRGAKGRSTPSALPLIIGGVPPQTPLNPLPLIPHNALIPDYGGGWGIGEERGSGSLVAERPECVEGAQKGGTSISPFIFVDMEEHGGINPHLKRAATELVGTPDRGIC